MKFKKVIITVLFILLLFVLYNIYNKDSSVSKEGFQIPENKTTTLGRSTYIIYM